LKDKVFIVIPAMNEATRIGGVLHHIQHAGFKNIVVVDDGSTDNTVAVSKEFGVTVVEHLINLGAGAATQTGIEFAVENGAEVIVTMDAEMDIVIGSRFMDPSNEIPKSRIFYNKIANVITWMITGIRVTDSQSGMKALSSEFAKKSKLYFNGFEFSVEMIRNIQVNNAKMLESPIKVVYTKDTLSKGQNLLTGIKMLAKLVRLTQR